MYENFASQNFLELKSKCLASGTLFVDDKFPPSQATADDYVWLRPQEIVQNPKLFVDGFSRFDTNQGKLGNCWFIAALANLTQNQNLFHQVVCRDNSDFDEGYAGIFHFRFWYNGKWTDVVIDDLLPTEQRKLVFMRSTEKNEFWSALVEKAYAKLYGGYDKLNGGLCNEALSNFTGGVTESYNLNIHHPDLYKMMLKSFNRKTLLDCAIFDKAKGKSGLIAGHAYSITKVVTVVTFKNEVVPLLRIRNPWGAVEWSGPWSDQSVQWKNVPASEKARIKFEDKDNGEFYMSFDDFLRHFDMLEICNLTPDLLSRDPRADRLWKMKSFSGSWQLKSIKHEKHAFTLQDPDEEDDENFCTIVVSLIHRQTDRSDHKQIGINIYSTTRGVKLVKCERPKAYTRESVFRYNLDPGRYAIVPFGNDNFDYMIRIFYEVKSSSLAAASMESLENIKLEIPQYMQPYMNRPPNVTIFDSPPPHPVKLMRRPSKKKSCCCSIC